MLSRHAQTMPGLTADVAAGQAIYTLPMLAAYDSVVHGVCSRLAWKCPTRRLLRHYDAHVTANHLDVGVGTGYFLDRCRFPSPSPRIALMDLNRNALDFTARRIARYRPAVYRRNVLQPLSLDSGKFDSVGLGYVLHCMPGPMASKAVAFDQLKALMNPGGVLFGSTVLHGGVECNWAARRLMDAYNRRGIFANRDDHLQDLDTGLRRRFEDVSIEVVGCVALFSGHA